VARARRIVWGIDRYVWGDQMSVSMIPGKSFLASLEIRDNATPPQPAPVAGPPAWTSNAGTSLLLSVAADGMSAWVDCVSTAVPGTYTLTVTADGDLGPAARLITETLEVVVTAPNTAATITIVPGPVV
jgi:hypothetical protein